MGNMIIPPGEPYLPEIEEEKMKIKQCFGCDEREQTATDEFPCCWCVRNTTKVIKDYYKNEV